MEFPLSVLRDRELTDINLRGTKDNSAAALSGLRYLFVFVPLFVEVAAAWILYHYPLDEATQRSLRRQIEERQSASSGPDPMR